jgi:peptidoglycan/xylan/chitin deacetylase (PgdA/CDA1 family)
MKVYTLHSVADNGLSLQTRLFEKFIVHVKNRDGFLGADVLDGPIPANGALLTFDDCYADNFVNALPVLEKHGVKAAFFFVPGFSGRIRWGSISRGHWADDRDADFTIPYAFMDVSQIITLRELGHTIGFHTRSHPNLPDCDTARMEDEIIIAKQEWEQRLGFRFQHFAYPRGRLNEAAVAVVARAGYKCAFSTRPGNIDAAVFASQPFALPRLPVARKSIFGWT